MLANRAVPEFRSYAWEEDDADGETDDAAQDQARSAGDDPDDVIDETGHEAGDDEGLAEAA